MTSMTVILWERRTIINADLVTNN